MVRENPPSKTVPKSGGIPRGLHGPNIGCKPPGNKLSKHWKKGLPMKYRCFKAQIYWLSYYSENSEHEYVYRVIDNRGAFTRFARYSDRVSSYHQGKSTTCEHLFTATGGFIWQSGKAVVCSAVNPTNARPTIDNNELNNILLFYLVAWRQQYLSSLFFYFFFLGGPTALTNSCSHKIKQGESGNHTTTHMVAWVGTNLEILSGHAPNRLLFRN